LLIADSCGDALLLTITVYLYPFVLEYSLIAIGAIGAILYYGIDTGSQEGNEHVANGFRNLVRVFRYGIKIEQTDDDMANKAHVSSHSGKDF
jgi:hypothetical protein